MLFRSPFMLSHRELFENKTAAMASRLDAMIAQRRLWHHQAIARNVAEGNRDVGAVMQLTSVALADEGFGWVWMIGRGDGDVYPSLQWRTGDDEPERASPEPADLAIDDDGLLSSAFRLTRPGVISLAAHPASPSLAGLPAGSTRMLVFPVATLSAKSLLLSPMPHFTGPGRSSPLDLFRTRYPRSYDATESYAAIAANCLESSMSANAARMATRLVGHIGHEVATPTAILGQAAIDALEATRIALPLGYPTLRTMLESRIASIKSDMRSVGAALNDALLVGRQSEGHLEMDFRPADVLGMLTEARDSVYQGTTFTDQNDRRRPYRIDLDASCSQLAVIVCDAEVLTSAFRNVFSNAVKYSLPRGDGGEILVGVSGGTGTSHVSLQISDWGLGIRRDEFDAIFQPFIQGSNRDTRKAIRGMGLGLWVARRIIQAHGGTIVCKSSIPTLRDPRRRERLEGYQTTFEIRLPRHIRTGVREVGGE